MQTTDITTVGIMTSKATVETGVSLSPDSEAAVTFGSVSESFVPSYSLTPD